MKEQKCKYFDIGIVGFMAYPNIKGTDPNVLESLTKLASDEYFTAIELSWILDNDKRKAAREILDTSHMRVCYGAQPRLLSTGLNPNHIDEAERLKAEKTLLDAIDEAEALGANAIAFLAGKWQNGTKDLAYSQLLKTTFTLCKYAKSKNMMVELEVFDYDIAKASLIGPAPYAAEFAGDVRKVYPNFGLLVDLSHIPMTYETSEFVVRTLKPYITHFHIGNTVCKDKTTKGYGDEHQRFGFPNGSNDVAEVLEFLRVLKNEGFFNKENPYILSFEVKPFENENPDVVIANTKRVLNKAWMMLED